MNSQKLNNPSRPGDSTRRTTYPNFWPNLVMALLVLGAPLGVKLILQSARAASSEQIKTTESMVVPRAGHAAYLLSDGRVYITGGVDANGQSVQADEIFDPTTQTFALATPETLGSATALPNPDPVAPLEGYSTGIALANGYTLYIGASGACLYPGPDNTTIALTNSDALHRGSASATELSTNDTRKILVAGGYDSNNQLVSPAALFNPAKITTDQDDYEPGTPATITGTGYAPNETVYLQVLNADGTPSTGAETGITNVVAIGAGNFSAV